MFSAKQKWQKLNGVNIQVNAEPKGRSKFGTGNNVNGFKRG